MADHELMLTEEVAALLRTTPEALHAARHRGAPLPPAVLRGKRLLWPRRDFDKWVKDEVARQARL